MQTSAQTSWGSPVALYTAAAASSDQAGGRGWPCRLSVPCTSSAGPCKLPELSVGPRATTRDPGSGAAGLPAVKLPPGRTVICAVCSRVLALHATSSSDLVESHTPCQPLTLSHTAVLARQRQVQTCRPSSGQGRSSPAGVGDEGASDDQTAQLRRVRVQHQGPGCWHCHIGALAWHCRAGPLRGVGPAALEWLWQHSEDCWCLCGHWRNGCQRESLQLSLCQCLSLLVAGGDAAPANIGVVGCSKLSSNA